MGYHKPVLIKEVIKSLRIKEKGIYIDCTLGGGGHFRSIIENLKTGIVVGIDMDEAAIGRNRIKLLDDDFKIVNEEENYLYFEKGNLKCVLVKDNFKHIAKIVKAVSEKLLCSNFSIDGILWDLGVSSRQLDDKKRGFSYIRDASLDMRMDRSSIVTAKDLVNGLFKKELIKILEEYGEEKYSHQIVNGILKARSEKFINTTNELCEVIKKSVPQTYKDPFKRTFQALRIAVNGELENLKESIEDLGILMSQKGRLVFITFHSLEGKIIKGEIEEEADFKLLGEIVPGEEEMKENSRSKSAKIIYFEKI